MERPTPSRSRRSERLAHSSPYARASPASKPSQQSNNSKRSAPTPFSTLRSMLSYVASPFLRSSPTLPSHMSDVNGASAMQVDTKSESGSEDEWNGQAPQGMHGNDVFDLAAAGGRRGEDFDQRADEWRHQHENGGRSSFNATASSSLTPKTLSMPGQLSSLKSAPSLPAITAASSAAPLKRIRSPPLAAASTSRTPLPSFLPPALRQTESQATYVSSTASRAALDAYLEAKRGQELTPEDLGIIETLSRNARAESASGPNSPKDYIKMGGWSAGSFAGTPRPIKALRGSRFDSASPAPSSPNASGLGEASFNLGVADSPSASPAPRRIRYLGPGMSPRRMLGKQRAGVKPLFDADSEMADIEQTPPKKRKTEEELVPTGKPTPAIPPISDPLPPRLHRLTSLPKPSPLSQSSIHPPASPAKTREEAVAEGRRRAADIMKELLEEETGPLELNQAQPEFIMINPYDTPRPDSPASASPSSLNRSITPGGSRAMLRSSLRGHGTPGRGAAARLEANRSGHKLTTLELLEGKHLNKTSSTPHKSTNKYADTPGRDEDMQDVEDMFDTPAPMKIRSTKKPKAAAESAPPIVPRQTEEQPVQPFEPPSLYTSARPAHSSTVELSSQRTSTFDSPSVKAVFDAADRDKAQAKPIFKPSISAAAPTVDEDEPMISVTPSKPLGQKADTSSVFLSAKDSALKVAEAALPFFTFTLAPPASGSKTASEAVRAVVLAREPETFTFTLSDANKMIPAPTPTSAPASKPPAFPAFKLPAQTSSGQWTCSQCDLKNPDSAKEKCTICDFPRPAPAAATVSTNHASTSNPLSASVMPKAAAALPNTGFNWAAAGGAPKKAAAGWTCGECMLTNPESATEKCQICDAPRPK